MASPVLLLVDPYEPRRRELLARLRVLGMVYEVAGGEEAGEIIDVWKPDVLVASLEQRGMSGLAMVEILRSLKHGGKPHAIVYGRPADDQNLPYGSELAIARSYLVDQFVPHDLPTDDVYRLVRRALARNFELAPDPSLSVETKLKSAFRDDYQRESRWMDALRGQASLEEVKELLGRNVGFDPVDAIDDTQLATWDEMLRARPSLHSIRQLLRKNIGVVIDDVEDTAETPWSDLLRARATPDNVRRLLTKPIGGKDDEG